MSWKATAFVKELRDGLTMTEKFVLLMLAEYHQTDSKLSWPSTKTLAFDCLIEERSVKRILGRLEEGGFIERVRGGGQGHTTAYKFTGLKGDPKTVTPETLSIETLTPGVGNSDRNSDPSGSAIRKEQIERVELKERVCKKHPDSGLTNWGTCWECYTEAHATDTG